jgi:hypothetical protein
MSDRVTLRKRVLAEGAVIVASILLALGADAAWDARTDRAAEEVALRDISAALESDIKAMSGRLARLEAADTAVATLREHLLSARPYTPTVDTLFGNLYMGAGGVVVNRAAYESLKARDLGLIKNDALRLGLVSVYEESFTRLNRANEVIATHTIEELRPYMLQHFRGLRAGRSATPVNYTVLVRDPYLMNVIDYRLDILGTNVIPGYKGALADASKLREAIEAELSGG